MAAPGCGAPDEEQSLCLSALKDKLCLVGQKPAVGFSRPRTPGIKSFDYLEHTACNYNYGTHLFPFHSKDVNGILALDRYWAHDILFSGDFLFSRITHAQRGSVYMLGHFLIGITL